MLKLKDDKVVVAGLKPELYFALGIADQAYADEGLECVITAGLNGEHNPGSLHAQGLAVDIRNSNCTPDEHARILAKLKRLERQGFDVVDEDAGATAATTGKHFHIELQPKAGESFWHVEATDQKSVG